MPRFDNLPGLDHLAHVALRDLERWVSVGGLTPLGIGVLVAYLYLTFRRHAPA